MTIFEAHDQACSSPASTDSNQHGLPPATQTAGSAPQNTFRGGPQPGQRDVCLAPPTSLLLCRTRGQVQRRLVLLTRRPE